MTIDLKKDAKRIDEKFEDTVKKIDKNFNEFIKRGIKDLKKK